MLVCGERLGSLDGWEVGGVLLLLLALFLRGGLTFDLRFALPVHGVSVWIGFN